MPCREPPGIAAPLRLTAAQRPLTLVVQAEDFPAKRYGTAHARESTNGYQGEPP